MNLFTLLEIVLTETIKEHHGRLNHRSELGKKSKLSSRHKQKRNEQKNKKISDGKAKIS
jgi:hypothetical protein